MTAGFGGPADDDGARVEAVAGAVTGGWSIRLLMLGIVSLLLGLALSWAQDVAAPWINEGEAATGGTVSFDSDGGRYRVVSSGPTRPAYTSIGCDVVDSSGDSQRVLGGEDANAKDRLGVSRVLEFTLDAGPATVRCADRYLPDSTHGRFQVVDANGPVSIAVWCLLGFGVALLVCGGVGLLLALRRAAAG
jgi:hypothetical protein